MKMIKRGFTLIELLVSITVGMILMAMIAVVVAVICVFCWSASEVSENGLKPSVERAWEGPEKPLSDSPASQE